MKKAVAYMRYSSDNQNETSIEHQRAAILSYCLKNKIQVEDEYVDQAFTATNDKRPAFQKMIQDALNKPDWSMILVYDLSRYSRNITNSINYKALLNDHNIKLISVTQEFGTGNEAFLLENITHLLNDYYSRNNSKVTHDSMVVKASKARHCGGKPPLGYQLDSDDRLIIDQYEAETVRKIFRMFELNYSYEKMAHILNDEGRITKSGNPFTKHSFPDLLRQEKYCGTYTWNKVRHKDSHDHGNSHAYKPLEEQVRIPGGCPAIISPEQFEAVQKKLQGRSKGGAGSKRRNHYMLSGLKIVKCASCGSYMVGTTRVSRGEKYTTYACPNRKRKLCSTKEIRTASLDKMVVGHLIRDFHLRDDLSRISKLLSHNEDYKRLVAKKRGNEKAIANVMKGIKLSYSETLITELEKLEREKASIDRAIAASTTSQFDITSENVKSVCRQFGRYLLVTEDSDVKTYLTSVIQEILVSNENVTITLKIA